MGLIFPCGDDPIVETLKAAFNANIIEIPEERFTPLVVLSECAGDTRYVGAIKWLLTGDILAPGAPNDGLMANVSGQRSRSVSVDVGLKILGNFLQGFGVPSAGITAKFDKATEVAFTFSNVHRAYYDPGYAGKLLAGRKLDKQNPAARPFFDANHCNMLLVDSTITSTDFTIDVTETSEQGIELDIPAIQQIVKGVSAGVDVKSSSKLSVTFGGTKPLAFAFSCCPVVTDPVDGTIRTFRPTPGIDAIGEGEEGEKADIGEPVLLSEEPEMLSIADAEATVEAK